MLARASASWSSFSLGVWPRVLIYEMFHKQFTGSLQPLFSKHDGLGFSHWIADHAFFMQAFHRSPVMSFPGTAVVMKREKEQRQHHFVHFIFVVLHMEKILFCFDTRKG